MNQSTVEYRRISILAWVFLSLTIFLVSMRSTSGETRDLILVAGQSNAVGFDAVASELTEDASDKHVMFWWRTGDPPPDRFDVTSDNRWTHLQAQPKGTPMRAQSGSQTQLLPRQYGNFSNSSGGFGPEIGFSRYLQSKQDRPLAIVKVAFSGTSVKRDWNPDAEPVGEEGACYRALIAETRSAIESAKLKGITLDLRALVWVQGESDATEKYAPEYATNLSHLLTRLRRDLEAPKLIALLAVNTRFGNSKNAHMPTVIAAQRTVAAKDPHCTYVDTQGAETLPPSHTHFTAKGTLEIGHRFAIALLEREAQQVHP